jgi:hypothetical protein
LDVEEKARSKDGHGKKVIEGSYSAPAMQKNPQNSHKKIFKQELKKKNKLLLKRRKSKLFHL